MRYVTTRTEALKYCSEVDRFIYSNDLPDVWFDPGYDHIALKAYSERDYEETVNEFKPVSEFIAETRMDGRYISLARLIGQYAINMPIHGIDRPSGVFDVEIMLARPGEQSDLPAELDHAEIYMPRGLLPVRKVLGNKNIRFHDENNDSHSWVSAIINGQMDELKFTDRRLAGTVQGQIEGGSSRIIYGKLPIDSLMPKDKHP